ncbi:hypothetical protein GCM10027217_16530 [Pseudomaricurvus hydrocarbonicus]
MLAENFSRLPSDYQSVDLREIGQMVWELYSGSSVVPFKLIDYMDITVNHV